MVARIGSTDRDAVGEFDALDDPGQLPIAVEATTGSADRGPKLARPGNILTTEGKFQRDLPIQPRGNWSDFLEMTPGVNARPFDDGSGRLVYFGHATEHFSHVIQIEGMAAAGYNDVQIAATHFPPVPLLPSELMFAATHHRLLQPAGDRSNLPASPRFYHTSHGAVSAHCHHRILGGSASAAS